MKVVLSLASLAFLAALSPGQVIFDIGFETGYTAGASLSGQNGWSTSAGNPLTVSTDRGAGGSATSVRADVATFTGASRYGWQTFSQDYNATNYPGPNADILVASADVYLTDAATDSWFGIDVWANDVSDRIAGIQLNLSQPVDFYQRTTTTSAGWISASLNNISANAWHNVRLEINRATGVISGFVDGQLLNTTGTVVFDNVDEVDLYTFRESGSTTVGYYDNYRVAAVPEPASMAVLSLGIVALKRRRKA